MSEFSHGQVMLTLALLASRGFWAAGKKNQPDLANGIAKGLDSLAPLRGQWQLVWGPGTYRYLGSAFDSSMIFMVRHRIHTARYAIVVRGTNPVDLFDWLLGDLLAHRQVPWHPATQENAPGARLSLSTALGLKILLNIRSHTNPEQVPQPGQFDYLLASSRAGIASLQQAGDESLTRAGELLADSPVGPALGKTAELLEKLRKYQKLWTLTGSLAGNVAGAVGDILQVTEVVKLLEVRKRLIRSLDRTLQPFADPTMAILMPTSDELASPERPGTGLLELLRNLANTHGDQLELYVTGHSKGGALAPALALFLADTQRNDELPIPDYYQWNPRHRAKIHCYAYAGPTPGNTEFAAYFNSQLGRRFYRYSNKLDIVTLAWRSEQLRTMSRIYGDTAKSLPGLDLLIQEMAEEVEELDYCHPGEDYPGQPGRKEKHVVEFAGPLKAGTSSYMLQELHQHIDAYIAFLGLDKVLSMKELLGVSKSARSK
jgi:hypothetical protein